MASPPLDARQRTRLHDLFAAAVDLDPADRQAFCDRECGDDIRLRAELAGLLDFAEAEDPGFLNTPVLSARARDGLEHGLLESTPCGGGASRVGPDPADPDAVGPYRIVERIGEGGMGVVYLAEQTEPIERLVALKIVKPGMDTRSVIRRFESERQTLARMDHPGIARIHDGGATERGHPYFVMEYVRGQPLTTYCDEHDVPVGRRLELFAALCDAVQHAHQRGVIHRDLKPSNVLVTERSGRPEPVVIDFGIARAASPDADAGPTETLRHELVGTLEYAAPEQVSPGHGGRTDVDVDSRADIYSLGVVLYELLTGCRPFAADTPVSERRPTPPSGQALRSQAAPEPPMPREPPTSPRELRGPLDWITMKALEADRERRYASASELAADVRRFLAREPVLAGPPALGYRLGLFLRRHRTQAVAVAAVLLALVGGGALAAVGLVRSRALAADLSSALESARASNDVLIEWLEMLNLENGPLRKQVMLDRIAQDADTAFAGRPRVEARLRKLLGQAYASIGRNHEAAENIRAALERLQGLHDVTLLELQDALWLGTWPFELTAEVDYRLELTARIQDVSLHLFADDHIELARAMARIPRGWQNVPRFVELAGNVLEIAERDLAREEPRWLAVADFLNAGARLTRVHRAARGEDASRIYEAMVSIYRDRVGLLPTNTRLLLTPLFHAEELAIAGQNSVGDRARELFAKGREIAMASGPVLDDVLPKLHTYHALCAYAHGICEAGLGNTEAGIELLEESLDVLRQNADASGASATVLSQLIPLHGSAGNARRSDELRRLFRRLLVSTPGGSIPLDSVRVAMGPDHADFFERLAACDSACAEQAALVPEVLEVASDAAECFDHGPLRVLVAGRAVRWVQARGTDPVEVSVPLMQFAVDAVAHPSVRAQSVALLPHCMAHLARAQIDAGDFVAAIATARRRLALAHGPIEAFWKAASHAALGVAMMELGIEGADVELELGYYGHVESVGLNEGGSRSSFRSFQAWALRSGEIDRGLAMARERLDLQMRIGTSPRALRETLWPIVRTAASERTFLGDVVEAARWVCRVEPDVPDNHVLRGAALLRAGDPTGALADFDRAAARLVDPGARDVRVALRLPLLRAIALVRTGEPSAARAVLESVRAECEATQDDDIAHLWREASTAGRIP